MDIEAIRTTAQAAKDIGKQAELFAPETIIAMCDELRQVHGLAATLPRRLDDEEWNTPPVGVISNYIYFLRAQIEQLKKRAQKTVAATRGDDAQSA